jgi:MFS family permease
MNKHPMNRTERRAVATLAGIFGLRMLGLFLVLPVLALYAERLPDHTPLLVGLAVGAYGLTQALLQIPYGLLSDRFGRKPLITVGLLVFALGSVVAALADGIWGVIFGRALQGAGAIAAVVLALTADLTREEQRTKAMALIGISIGLVFIIALIAGPILGDWIGVSGIFWVTCALALAAIVVLWLLVPTPIQIARRGAVQTAPSQIKDVLSDPQLLRFDVGIFVLHLVLTAMFVVVPLALVHQGNLAVGHHWKVYVPVMVLSVAAVIPLIYLSTRTHLVRKIFSGAIMLLLVSQLLMLAGYHSLLGLVLALWVFFWGFNALEAMLPSLISRVAPAASKGTAIGVYNTFEFMGVFSGGVIGGWIYGVWGMAWVFVFCLLMLGVWLMVAVTGPAFKLFDSRLLRVGQSAPEQARVLANRLLTVPGVMEAIVIAEEGVAYLKIDKRALDEEKLREFSAS